MEIEDIIKQKTFQSPVHRSIINVVYTAGWLNSLHTRLLRPYDISPQQFNVLRILRGQHPNPATVNLLQERMVDAMSNASRLVEKLRLKGLLERKTNTEDRRAVDVLITIKGLELLNQIDQDSAKWNEPFKHFNHHDANSLNDLLNKLRG